MVYWISRFCIVLFLRLAFHLKIYGQENLPHEGGYILAPNHTSYFDPPVTGSACPRRVYFMAKEELFRDPLLGIWIRLVGCIPVNYGVGDRHAIRLAVELLKKGECLCIYPEGMRVPPGATKEGEPGIAMISEMSGAKIVPMAILGTQPWHRKIFGFFPWVSRIEVRIGKPLHFDFKYEPKKRKEAYEKIVDQIMRQIRELKVGRPA